RPSAAAPSTRSSVTTVMDSSASTPTTNGRNPCFLISRKSVLRPTPAKVSRNAQRDRFARLATCSFWKAPAVASAETKKAKRPKAPSARMAAMAKVASSSSASIAPSPRDAGDETDLDERRRRQGADHRPPIEGDPPGLHRCPPAGKSRRSCRALAFGELHFEGLVLAQIDEVLGRGVAERLEIDEQGLDPM